MAIVVKWTLQAEEGLEKVINYLEEEWTFREILKLEENVKSVIKQLQMYPDLFPKSETYKDLHKAIIDKNNYLIYRVNSATATIEIINFRGTKQRPK